MHKTFITIGIVLGAIAVGLVVANFVVIIPPGNTQQQPGSSSNPLSGLQNLYNQGNSLYGQVAYDTAPASQTGGMSPTQLASLAMAIA